jgi:hypothetical protein
MKFIALIFASLSCLTSCSKKNDLTDDLCKNIHIYEEHGKDYPSSLVLAKELRKRWQGDKSKWGEPIVYNTIYDWQDDNAVIFLSWSGYRAENVIIDVNVNANQTNANVLENIVPVQTFWSYTAPKCEWLWEAKFVVSGLTKNDSINVINVKSVR